MNRRDVVKSCAERDNGEKYWRHNNVVSCVCGQELFNSDPAGCDVICDGSRRQFNANSAKCWCRNGQGGPSCNQNVCRLGRYPGDVRLYCLDIYDSYDADCENVDPRRNPESFPECECHNNAAKSSRGFCVCPTHLEGLFCEKLRLPDDDNNENVRSSTTKSQSNAGWSFPTTDRVSVGSTTPTATTTVSASPNYALAIGIPTAVLISLLIFLICHRLYKTYKRKYSQCDRPHCEMFILTSDTERPNSSCGHPKDPETDALNTGNEDKTELPGNSPRPSVQRFHESRVPKMIPLAYDSDGTLLPS